MNIQCKFPREMPPPVILVLPWEKDVITPIGTWVAELGNCYCNSHTCLLILYCLEYLFKIAAHPIKGVNPTCCDC